MNRIATGIISPVTCFVFAFSFGAPLANASDIPFDYIELERQRVYSDGQDFDSWRELKTAVKRVLSEYECPSCKGHQCKGRQVQTLVRKVDVYREVEKTGFFGGKKKVDEFVKTAWRVENIVLKQKDGGWGILSDEDEGYVSCSRKGCGWEMRGGAKPQSESNVRWVTIGDLLNGNF